MSLSERLLEVPDRKMYSGISDNASERFYFLYPCKIKHRFL